MSTCPVITIFYINFYGNSDLKMSKISIFGNFPSAVKLVTILSMMSLGKPIGDYLKMSRINQFFLSYTTIPWHRDVLGTTISNLEENLLRAENILHLSNSWPYCV